MTCRSDQPYISIISVLRMLCYKKAANNVILQAMLGLCNVMNKINGVVTDVSTLDSLGTGTALYRTSVGVVNNGGTSNGPTEAPITVMGNGSSVGFVDNGSTSNGPITVMDNGSPSVGVVVT